MGVYDGVVVEEYQCEGLEDEDGVKPVFCFGWKCEDVCCVSDWLVWYDADCSAYARFVVDSGFGVV